jgi:hypothetical protein
MRQSNRIILGSNAQWTDWELSPGELLLFADVSCSSVRDVWATRFSLIESPPEATRIFISSEWGDMMETLIPFGAVFIFNEQPR